MRDCELLTGDVCDKLREIPEKSVHCVVTSPPYWGLRDYGTAAWQGGDVGCDHKAPVESGVSTNKGNSQTHPGRFASGVCYKCGATRVDEQLGLERTPEAYVENMVAVFRELRQVLRDDGTVWLNMGDCYNAGRSGGWAGGKHGVSKPENAQQRSGPNVAGLKPKDLIGVPWLLAFALRADGWYLRSAIVWAKGISFCPDYSGSVMPESVNGWRWERCRVRTKAGACPRKGEPIHTGQPMSGHTHQPQAEWSDCPGCDKCRHHGGYVLRKGSWRPTSAYEMVFLLAKSERYFCDAEAVKEVGAYPPGTRAAKGSLDRLLESGVNARPTEYAEYSGTRNLRNVWCINPQSYKEAHFATYPEKLVEPCILAGTSSKGVCPTCGSPWARVVERERAPRGDTFGGKDSGCFDRGQAGSDYQQVVDTRTLCWRPTCECPEHEPVPATVLDPFMGSGTTLVVALRHNRHAIGIELKPEYVELARKRIKADAAQRYLPGI